MHLYSAFVILHLHPLLFSCIFVYLLFGILFLKSGPRGYRDWLFVFAFGYGVFSGWWFGFSLVSKGNCRLWGDRVSEGLKMAFVLIVCGVLGYWHVMRKFFVICFVVSYLEFVVIFFRFVMT